jgi:hypothetical protein
MLTISGRARAVCDGIPRRQLLQAGGAFLPGLSLPELLAAGASASTAQVPRARSVIFLLLFGGPSQLETFDMKPEAAAQIRGPFQPIASRTPELRICEHLPGLATVSDKFSVIRTMSHSFNDHSGGGHYIQTGRRWHVPIGGGFSPTPKDWPSVGSVVEYSDQQIHGLSRALPSYMVLPNSLGALQEKGQYPRPGEHAGWIGARYNPLTTAIQKRSVEDNPYWRSCTDEELSFQISELRTAEDVSAGRMARRQSLLGQFDAARSRVEATLSASAGAAAARSGFDAFRERAFSLMTSTEIRSALNLRAEPAEVRDRYGRHLFGQSVLMARRLVEAGVRYVTVHYDCVDGYSWDSHRNSDDVKRHLLPTFDQACSALLSDLDDRGLLSETLVIATGEMGRTPKANAQWGRDHWSTLFSSLIAGAGVRGGQLHGRTDRDAAYAEDTPVSPEDLAATICHAMGIDPDIRIANAENRPVPIIENGTPLLSLW